MTPEQKAALDATAAERHLNLEPHPSVKQDGAGWAENTAEMAEEQEQSNG